MARHPTGAVALRDALPISPHMNERRRTLWSVLVIAVLAIAGGLACAHWSAPLSYEERLLRAGLADTLGSDARELYGESPRSQEHTSELQSLRHIVCRLPLE